MRRKRRREGESGVVWTSGERDVASGRNERCDASQDAQDAWDAESSALGSGRNAGGSDARSVFADGIGGGPVTSNRMHQGGRTQNLSFFY